MRPCASCGAQVLDLRHERTGKLAPIDAMPTMHGGTVVVDEEAGTYRVLTKAERAELMNPPREHIEVDGEQVDVTPALRLHRSHYATCPDAVRWRSRRRYAANSWPR